jgi:hypothetical protein
MDIARLKAHSMNAEIYGDAGPDDGLLESVRVIFAVSLLLVLF